MRKNSLLTIPLFFLISFISWSQTTSIPDANFEQALIDLGHDVAPINGSVPTANISSIVNLDVSVKDITDLTGIEDFVALKNLDCSENKLSTLNISQNTNITELYCVKNDIKTLEVTTLPNLIRLWCSYNKLTNLNITQNPSIISLLCDNNLLTSLNTSNNINLNVLVCEINQITSLDISNNILLNRFQCGGNNTLPNLDVSNNINLSYLSCDSCQISTLNLYKNTKLNTLICFENLLTELDLSQNTVLESVFCHDNDLCLLNLNNNNNGNLIDVSFTSNDNLNCVIVDNPNANHTSWMPTAFSKYVASQNDCSDFVNIDELDDIITFSAYTLPTLIHGKYYTATNGNGVNLNAGDIISTSQTIYIYNQATCFSNESSFNVVVTDQLYIPKYFTPNNDRTNDFWQVLDNTNTITSISIFNRYGKLLKSLLPNTQGWNGVFNGKLMPTDDYWYVLFFNTGETIKGHFTLKR